LARQIVRPVEEVVAGHFVYVANADSQDLSVFELAPHGELLLRATVEVHRPALSGRSMVLALGPSGKFLYAGHLSSAAQSAVSTFSIDAHTGIPEWRASSPVVDSMSYLSVDRTGHFLLGASYAGGKVAVYEITNSGAIGAAQQVISTEPKAHCVLTDPSNRVVLHTSVGGDVIYQQSFDPATGKMSPNEPPTKRVDAGSGPRFLVFSPGERFVYVISELDGAVYVFPFDAGSGTLGEKAQVASSLPAGFSGKPWGADIHLRPDGKYLYVSERTSSTVTAFAVDAARGTLATVASYPTVKQPRAFNIDPSGEYLVCAGQLSNSVMIHRIDGTTGRLTPLEEYAAGKNPTWVEMT
jgi:6-phosphogluconolactonase